MRFVVCFAMGIVVLAANGYAQDKEKEPVKAEITQAMYMVGNLH